MQRFHSRGSVNRIHMFGSTIYLGSMHLRSRHILLYRVKCDNFLRTGYTVRELPPSVVTARPPHRPACIIPEARDPGIAVHAGHLVIRNDVVGRSLTNMVAEKQRALLSQVYTVSCQKSRGRSTQRVTADGAAGVSVDDSLNVLRAYHLSCCRGRGK